MTALDYETPKPDPLRSPPIRAMLLYVLLVAGVALWLQFGAIEWAYGAQRWGVVVFAALALVPFTARPLGELLEKIRRLPQRARPAVALGVFLASAGTLYYFNFHREESDIAPSVCDEYSYLIQAQLLAHGRLWSTGHELPEFFTTFQVIGGPVYSSIYFPGTALWIAPWSMIDSAGLYAWIGPWLAASLAVMLVYLITAELLDDLAGIAGGEGEVVDLLVVFEGDGDGGEAVEGRFNRGGDGAGVEDVDARIRTGVHAADDHIGRVGEQFE